MGVYRPSIVMGGVRSALRVLAVTMLAIVIAFAVASTASVLPMLLLSLVRDGRIATEQFGALSDSLAVAGLAAAGFALLMSHEVQLRLQERVRRDVSGKPFNTIGSDVPFPPPDLWPPDYVAQLLVRGLDNDRTLGQIQRAAEHAARAIRRDVLWRIFFRAEEIERHAERLVSLASYCGVRAGRRLQTWRESSLAIALRERTGARVLADSTEGPHGFTAVECLLTERSDRAIVECRQAGVGHDDKPRLGDGTHLHAVGLLPERWLQRAPRHIGARLTGRLYNGLEFAVTEVRLEAQLGELYLRLRGAPTTHFAAEATTLHIDLHDDDLISDSLLSRKPQDSPLANQLAIHAVVRTSDDRIVWVQRGDTRQAPRMFNTAITGVMELAPKPANEGGDRNEIGLPDPVRTLLREGREELGTMLKLVEDHCVFFAVAIANYVESDAAGEPVAGSGQISPYLVGEALVDMTYSELLEQQRVFADRRLGAFEVSQVRSHPIDSDPATFAKFLQNEVKPNFGHWHQAGLVSMSYAFGAAIGWEKAAQELQRNDWLSLNSGPRLLRVP